MKHRQILLCLPALAVLFTFGPAAGSAQTTTSAESEDPITLSTFEVRSEKDEGFRVENATGTTRIAMPIYRTPLPIQVITSEFAEDNNLNGIDVLSFVSSVNVIPNSPDGQVRQGGGEPIHKFRGHDISAIRRNGMSFAYGFPTENIDRVEVAKGPMAVFVGGATLGGSVNIITKQPQFTPSREITYQFGEYNFHKGVADFTGPLSSTLAYRMIAAYENSETWREHTSREHKLMDFSLLWRPNADLSVRLNVQHDDDDRQEPSVHEYGNPDWIREIESPRPELLAYTGLTADQYRDRIKANPFQWSFDTMDVYGISGYSPAWNTLYESPLHGQGRKFNFNAPGTYLDIESTLVELEGRYRVTDWLELRGQARHIDNVRDVNNTIIGDQRRLGVYWLLFPGFAQLANETKSVQLDVSIDKQLGPVRNRVLLGYEYNDSLSENLLADNTASAFSAFGPVPASAAGIYVGAPATLTGQNVLIFYDPRVHRQPDVGLKRVRLRDNPAAQPAWVVGSFGDTQGKNFVASYIASLWEDRFNLFSGYRKTDQKSLSGQTSLAGNRVNTSPADRKADNYMLGLSVEPIKGLSFYASYNIGEDFNPQRNTFVEYLDPTLFDNAEFSANRTPNLKGKGYEAGVKFDLIDNKLTGSLGVFEISRANTTVLDMEKTGNDIRNNGTTASFGSPGPAGPRIRWWRAIDGDKSAGMELDLVYTPNRNWAFLGSVGHLWTNERTVSPLTPGTTGRALIETQILTGRPLDNTPDTTFDAFGKYTFTDGRFKGLSLGLGLNGASASQYRTGFAFVGLETEGYVVAHGMVSYTTKVFGDTQATITLNVQNLTNKLYTPGGYTWAPPRQFFVSTKFKF